MSDTARNTTNADVPFDTKTEQARRLRDAWCKEHECEPKDIPARAQKAHSRKSIGTLAYAMRKVVGLDMFPSAELLGIEPAEVMVFSRDMRVLVEQKKEIDSCEKLEALLIKAGLRQLKIAKPKKIPVAPKPPKHLTDDAEPDGRKANAEEREHKRRETEVALTEGRKEIARQACEIMGMPLEIAFDMTTMLGDQVNTRSVVFALAYALDERKNFSGIARSFNTSSMTITAGVRRVDKILRADPRLHGWWQEKIKKVCAAFSVEPERLLRAT